MDNRHKLLQCALDLFAARGYAGVGVQEIVDAAGVTKPTLYHYFGSKQGLLEALMDDYTARLDALLAPASGSANDPPLALYRVVSAYFQFARENSSFYRLTLALWFSPPGSEAYGVVSTRLERQYRIIEALFEAAAEFHGNMRGRHQRYAITLLGMINNYIAFALNGYTELNDELVYQAVHQFMYGIYS